jgi:YVTN family beta-propeller protein
MMQARRSELEICTKTMNPRDAARVSLLTFSMLTLMLTGCRSHDFPQYPANYREYVYVTNGGSGTVTVLDVVNVRVDRELPVGQNPVAVAASPSRNEVYVVNSGAEGSMGSISVINAENNSVVATIPLQRQPVSIDLDADGKLAYVANSGSNSISVVDLKNRRETSQIGAGEEPVAARLSADGKTLAVTNRRGNSVSLVDPASLTVRAVFEGCPGASDVVMLPDSSKAFVACSAGHQVMAISLARASLAASAQAGAAPATAAVPDRLEAMMVVGHAPVQLALKPDGGEVFVSNLLSDSVSEIYNGTDEVGATYMIGDGPVRGLVSSDNSLLYVANFHSQYVVIYGINDGRRVGSVHVGDGPSAMAFSAAGHLLFVVDARSGDVAVVRTASPSLYAFTLLSAGRNPNAIVDKAFKLP